MQGQPPQIEIVSAGNEVLIGDVLDTNSNWLCRQITQRGGSVQRTVMVRDDVAAIAAEISGALDRAATIVFTVGGLGPTYDDRTLAGVAAALGVELELHAEAEQLVARKYAELFASGQVPSAQMNDARRKMAMLPADATPLFNPIGGAPGVVCYSGAAAIISLPGVPEELRAIFADSFDALFGDSFGGGLYEERLLIAATQDESVVAPQLAAAERQHPDVYIKSRAKRFGPEQRLRLTLSARADDAATLASLLDAAAAQLLREVSAAGIAIAPAVDDDRDR